MKLFTIRGLLAIASFVLIVCGTGCNSTSQPKGPALVFVVEVSEADLLHKFADYSTDTTYNKAIDMAQSAKQSGSKTDFITLFEQSYNTIAPEGKLSAIFGYVPRFQKKLTMNSSNKEIIAVLREADDEAIKSSVAILERRFKKDQEPPITSPMSWLVNNIVIGKNEDKTVITVTREKGTSLISVRFTGSETYPDRLRGALVSTGRLEFWETYENEEVYPLLVQADKIISRDMGMVLFNESKLTASTPTKKQAKKHTDEKDFFDGAVINTDSNGKSRNVKVSGHVPDPVSAAKGDSSLLINTLFRVLNPPVDNQGALASGAAVGLSFGRDTAKVNGYLALDAVRKVLPRDIKFWWGLKPMNRERDVYELFAIKCNPASRAAPLDGEVITDATQGYDQAGTPDITLTMNEAGSAKWKKMTMDASTSTINGRAVKRSVAITLDGRVFSCPRVQGAISGGHTEISGMSDLYEAQNLARMLNGGALPAQLKIVAERVEQLQ
jgi:SecD/SecF fusion protein